MIGLEDTPTVLPAVQQHLFGEPPQLTDKGQLWTPMHIARRMVEWIPKGFPILEPSAGSGNLIAALIEAHYPRELITAVEKDPAWAEYIRRRFDGRVRVLSGDFFEHDFKLNSFAYVLSNWPYENNEHLRFAIRCLELAPVVVTLVPISFESTQERDAKLWAPLGIVTRRAHIPERLDHGGPESGGTFDSVCLKIQRRREPRREGEVVQVAEEFWRKVGP